MANRQQGREASGIGALRDRQPQQPHRLQNRDDAADDEGHPVDIGDLLSWEMEGAAENAGKHEHPRHAEDILQTEKQKLRRWQLFVDADLEYLRLCLQVLWCRPQWILLIYYRGSFGYVPRLSIPTPGLRVPNDRSPPAKPHEPALTHPRRGTWFRRRSPPAVRNVASIRRP